MKKAPILTDREIWYILQDSRTCTYQNRMKLVAESQRDADQFIIDRQEAEINKLKQEIDILKARLLVEQVRSMIEKVEIK